MPNIKKEMVRELTKSEQLLLKIGQEVECDMCHQQVLMTDNWKMTAYRDDNGNFVDKKAVCPICQPSAMRNNLLLVSI